MHQMIPKTAVKESNAVGRKRENSGTKYISPKTNANATSKKDNSRPRRQKDKEEYYM
jgi:hypothetical protein